MFLSFLFRFVSFLGCFVCALLLLVTVSFVCCFRRYLVRSPLVALTPGKYGTPYQAAPEIVSGKANFAHRLYYYRKISL